MDQSDQNTKNLINKLLNEANLFLLYLDLKGKISFCNKKMEFLSGGKGCIIGTDWFEVLCHDKNSAIKEQMFRAVIEDSVKYRRVSNFEGLFSDKDGSERFVSWDVSPVLTDAGDLEGTLLVGIDLTGLREREEGRKNIDETLKYIFSSIKEYALYVVNLEGNITYYGMGSETIFGWLKSEIIFKHVSIFHPQQESESGLAFILEQVRQLGQLEIELELVKKDGQTFPVILTVTKFLDPNSQLKGYIFIAKDITERKKLENQILQSEKLAAIGQLSAGIAHEINNPLFVISGRLEMLMEEEVLSEEIKQTLKIVNEQADRIRRLVDELLKFSRKKPPKFETVNINEIIEGVMPLVSYHKAPAAKIEIVRDLAGDLALIKGDLNQLQEVFVNLIINAFQAMPEGGFINIKTRNLWNKFAEIRVSDTGSGISPESQKNIFMPFYSTKKDGTGLGLSICYNIVKNHNGTIDIESSIGKGTTFIIRFPAA